MSGKNARDLLGRVHDEIPRIVKEELFFDGAISCFVGVKVTWMSQLKLFRPYLLVWSRHVTL